MTRPMIDILVLQTDVTGIAPAADDVIDLNQSSILLPSLSTASASHGR